MNSKIPTTTNRFGILSFPKHNHDEAKTPTLQNEQRIELLKESQSRSAHNSKTDYINFGHEDQMKIDGYAEDPFKRIVTIFFMVLTLGVVRLFFHWYPHLYMKSVNRRVPLRDAQRLLITEKYQDKHTSYHVKELKILTPQQLNDLENKYSENSSEHINKNQNISLEVPISLSLHFGGGQFKHATDIRMFSCKKVTYIWDNESGKFVKLKGLDVDITSDVFHDSKPLSEQEQRSRRLIYGFNSINVPEQSVLSLLFLEVLNPFYIFQAASFVLWFSDSYYAYAAAILILSVFGIIMSIVQTRRNQQNLKSTVHSSDITTVLRSVKTNAEEVIISKTLSTEKLVPGDIMEIPAHGCVMHCDAVLLTGNCILNEAMLTGESVPVTKTPIPNLANVAYDSKEHSRHTLYCGTRIIQTRYLGDEKVLAIVIRTGFSTAKGGLVRSILYPPPVDFRFEKDSYRFIGLLAVIAGGGFIFTIVSKAMRGISATAILVQALDLITIVVPPALPAAMTVGRMYAQRRLQKKNIFCISPRTINVAGSIDCVCFDKTGTLTEDGLDMLYVVPIVHKYFQIPIREISKMVYDKFMFGIVTCHSITLIDGKMRGDPLDLKMFESTEWTLEEPNIADNSKFDMIFPTVVKPPVYRRHECISIPNEGTQKQNGKKKLLNVSLEIGILREFPFSSTLQRMSVIVRRLGASNYECFCKGSPEMVLTLVKPETVPDNFSEVLESYTQQGYRVLALAYKELSKMSYPKIQRVSRELIETDLELLGLIVMENRLKPETAPVINLLNEAKIRTIMITGDNLLTALSVARECDIITNDQTILTINTYIPDDNSSSPELYFVVNNSSNGFSSKSGENKNHTILNIGCEDYSILSNDVDSSSVVSLDTTESCTINTEVTASGQYEIPNKVFEGSFTSSSYRFAITGKTWTILRKHFPEVIPKVVTRGVVFARMSPDQKQMLVQELQSLGYYVAMVGDGANDVGALRTAHCGISLSDTEASVASPFTSKTANITAITNVISQGRAALVTSFSIFKYMAAYSITQFISVMLLYSIDSNLTDVEFLYIDLFIITTFAYYFGKTEAYTKRLVPERPLNSLIGFTPVLSLVIQLVLVGVFQIVAFYHLLRQPWYHPQVNPSHDAATGCWENYTIFTVSSFQYIILAVVYSKGKPHRKPMWTNRGFVISAIGLGLFSIYLTLGPCPFLSNFFELVLPPNHWNNSISATELNVSLALNETNIFDFVPSQIFTENITLETNQTENTQFAFDHVDFRFVLLGYALLNFLLALFFESFIVDYLIAKILRLKFHNVKTSKKRFLQIDDELKRDGTWPQINETYSGGFQSPNAQPDSLTSGFSLVVEQTSFFSDENKVLDCFVENGRTKTRIMEGSSTECKTPNRFINQTKSIPTNEVTKSMFELNTFNS